MKICFLSKSWSKTSKIQVSAHSDVR